MKGSDQEQARRKEKKGTKCCDVHERRNAKIRAVALETDQSDRNSSDE